MGVAVTEVSLVKTIDSLIDRTFTYDIYLHHMLTLKGNPVANMFLDKARLANKIERYGKF